MADLLELAARCEAATGGDRELDARIWCIVGIGSPWTVENCWLAATIRPPDLENGGMNLGQWLDRFPNDSEEIARSYNIPRYTASIDAAVTLVPEHWSWMARNDQGDHSADVWNDDYSVEGNGRAPALALCAASLRARAKS